MQPTGNYLLTINIKNPANRESSFDNKCRNPPNRESSFDNQYQKSGEPGTILCQSISKIPPTANHLLTINIKIHPTGNHPLAINSIYAKSSLFETYYYCRITRLSMPRRIVSALKVPTEDINCIGEGQTDGNRPPCGLQLRG